MLLEKDTSVVNNRPGMMLPSSFVARLKENYPGIASVASRAYALSMFFDNRRVVQGSRTLRNDLEFLSIAEGRPIERSSIVEATKSGDVIRVPKLVEKLGLEQEVDQATREGYGISYSDLEQIHELLSTEEILDRTARFKNSDAILTLQCTLLKSLFFQENKLFAELMPNLRPHVPFHKLRKNEAAIERKIGRGKLNAHGPHKDSWRYHPQNTINVWLALTEVDEKNGMFLLPRSQAYCPRYAENEIVPGCQTYPAEQYLTKLDKGDALIFSAELLHGSIVNQTSRTRFAFTMRCSIEDPVFHRGFLYNYAQVLPSFSNMSQLKMFPRSDFVCPSRDTAFDQLATPTGLDIVECGEKQMVIRTPDGLKRFPRRCPHKGIDLKCGHFDGENLVCPQHQMRVRAIRTPEETVPSPDS
jgi:hypothetical protein